MATSAAAYLNVMLRKNMNNYVYIAQSLDGFIAGPNGELDWLENIENPEQSDFGFSAFMSTVDALVMGKNTFEKVFSFGMWSYEKPVFVASSSLSALPSTLEGKAFLLKGAPKSMITELNKKGYANLYIDGGALTQSFLKEDLIDELIITTIPILLGEGISLFGYLPKQVHLKLAESEVLLNQLVKTRYKIKKV